MHSNPKEEILVCEHASWWAPAMRRVAPGIQVREFRIWDQCEAASDDHAHRALVVLEGREDRESEAVATIRQATVNGTRIAVATTRRLAPLKWVFKEAGALQVVTSCLAMTDTAKLARRLWRLPPRETGTPKENSNNVRFKSRQEWHASLPWA